ncbi:tetratricopeptide repeat protein [Tunturiibacter gelidoferens]|uniref:Tetratricopeptide (TPR) repeat protein n=1 Tax=Tunturiibacter gelidiferens TaxID=3069689 RepID=A0ACC5P474_9BACT|nr:tetratricopeptide (TPR) repeat protein [Edaphobacter lichenicola]
MSLPAKPSSFRHPAFLLVCLASSLLLTPLSVRAQSSSSSSSSESPPDATISKEAPAKSAPRIAQPEAGGSAITLETSEPLFDLAVALNVCGYDDGLANSAPVRLKIRDDINAQIAASADTRTSRDALCAYVREHTLVDASLNLAQYISLALYLSPPPSLSPIVGETELPPDSTQVVNILPLLRTFAESVNLHAIWIEHRAEYEDLLKRVHDPLTRTILNTNVYLHLPVSSYDGRRFLVLLEPMLSPSVTNARIYSNDYIVVTSPAAEPIGAVHMDDIRHSYLHYEIEPLVYSRASAMERLQPLLKAVQDAPLDYTYKTEIVPLITECLIKAVEDRTMDVGIPKPAKPTAVKQRAEIEQYNADLSAYEREAEATRRKAVDLAMRQGWVLTEYFYNQVGQMEKESVSLKEYMGEMVYGMDVDRERHHAQQIAFLPSGSRDVLRRAPQQLTGLQLAEEKIFKGDLAGASDIANKVLADPKGDHAQAHYVLARVNLMQRQPGAAFADFQEVLDSSKDPRTLAWSHIYLGRLYDVKDDRRKAVAEYQAALTVRDAQPDTKAAAEKGIKEPFVAPKVAHQQEEDDDAPLDPSGKAEKDAYRPPPPH